MSRGRKEERIYTDDIEELRENVTREREREMAMELIKDGGREKKRGKTPAPEMEVEQEAARQQSPSNIQEAQENEMAMEM